MTRTLILLVRAYQVLMAWRPPVCRYAPTCSAYAIEALEAHGAARGSWLAARRVLRCHPWREGGYDPVPDPRPRRGSGATDPRRAG